MSLENRTVVITGATGGLGRVVTRIFADQGANLVLMGRTQGSLDKLVDELSLPDERVLIQTADVNDPAVLEGALQAIKDKFGRADILLNLVGGWAGGKPVVEVEEQEISSMVQQHLWPNFYLSKVFVPHFAENGWGRFIIVSSPNVARPPGNNSPYAIGKATAEALTISLAEEMKHTGVTANILLVKKIDAARERESGPGAKGADWTYPEEIASAMLYLCTEEAGMVSGARIPLYGHQT